MDDRKGKGIMKYESHDSPPGSAQRAWGWPRTWGRAMESATAAHAREDSGTRFTGVQGPANPRWVPKEIDALPVLAPLFSCSSELDLVRFLVCCRQPPPGRAAFRAGDQPAAPPPGETAARRTARMELSPSVRHDLEGQAQGQGQVGGCS